MPRTPSGTADGMTPLERDGLVTRELTLSVPVRVDYSLTPMGRSLLPLLASVKAWAEAHMDEVLAALRCTTEPSAAEP